MSYAELVNDAFIKPIRSVLIVDDEYPTWESFLSSDYVATEDWNKTRPSVLQMVKNFRQNSPSMIVDIHDGSEKSDSDAENLSNHLFQSDLLVLDYHLEGDTHGGEKSVGIARKLLENSHFNLIVLHTSLTDLSEPFEAMVLGLLSKPKVFPEFLVQKGAGIYAGFNEEEEEEFDEQIETLIGKMHYMHCYQLGVDDSPSLKDLQDGAGPFSDFKTQMAKKNIKGGDMLALGVWWMSKLQGKLESQFSDNEHYALSWSDTRIRGASTEYWVRTNRGFIAFANKNDTSDLVDVLQKALMAWQPTPTRLLSARLRTELDQQGVIAEDEAFEDRLIFRKFYCNLIESSGENIQVQQRNAIEGQARRHIESLVDKTIEPVIEYGQKIVAADTGGVAGSTFLKHYGEFKPEQIDASSSHYNSYISSKPVNGWHISPGHIFCLPTQEDVPEEIWVCLSPACDLVPGQRKVGIQTSDGSVKSFMAVKLEGGCSSELSAREINSNDFIFLQKEEKIEIRSIYKKPSSSQEADGQEEAVAKEPHWRMFFAKDSGKFKPRGAGNNGERELDLQWLVTTGDGLQLTEQSVQIKWQLRYEYALNLNQKLGSNLTRIGLDFLGT